MAEIMVNLVNKPKGKLVPVQGLGYLENGQTHTLTEEQVSYYKSRYNTEPPTLVGRPMKKEDEPPQKEEEEVTPPFVNPYGEDVLVDPEQEE